MTRLEIQDPLHELGSRVHVPWLFYESSGEAVGVGAQGGFAFGVVWSDTAELRAATYTLSGTFLGTTLISTFLLLYQSACTVFAVVLFHQWTC